MPSTSVAVSLQTTQTEADITANGALLPYGFEYEENGTDGYKLFRWVKMKTAISAGVGKVVATEVVAASLSLDAELIVGIAAQGPWTCRGVVVATAGIPAGGAGWVQVKGQATVDGDATGFGVGDLLKVDAAGELQAETAIATPTVFTVGLALAANAGNTTSIAQVFFN